MNWPYEWQIGWRYTLAGRAGRRNGFISFISGVSMLGIALGVAALIIVLSVMNGFQKEVRDRMLSAIAHVEILQPQGGALPDWQAVAARAKEDPAVVAAAPFIAVQSLLATTEPIGRLRGREHRYNGVPVVVTYHPAYLLRNLPDKAKAWADLCLARALLER